MKNIPPGRRAAALIVAMALVSPIRAQAPNPLNYAGNLFGSKKDDGDVCKDKTAEDAFAKGRELYRPRKEESTPANDIQAMQCLVRYLDLTPMPVDLVRLGLGGHEIAQADLWTGLLMARNAPSEEHDDTAVCKAALLLKISLPNATDQHEMAAVLAAMDDMRAILARKLLNPAAQYARWHGGPNWPAVLDRVQQFHDYYPDQYSDGRDAPDPSEGRPFYGFEKLASKIVKPAGNECDGLRGEQCTVQSYLKIIRDAASDCDSGLCRTIVALIDNPPPVPAVLHVKPGTCGQIPATAEALAANERAIQVLHYDSDWEAHR